MRRTVALLIMAACFGLAPAVVQAQVDGKGLVSLRAAEQAGLQRRWFTQVELNSSRYRLTHLTQHVNSSEGYTVHEIDSDTGKVIITERDLDLFGKPLGKEQAQKRAQELVQKLELEEQHPKLTTQVVPQITLFAVADGGFVHAIDAQTGRTLWAERLGNPLHPTDAAAANDQMVAVVNGTTLHVLKASTGELAWKRSLRGAPGAGPALSDRYVIVPMLNGMVEAYQLENYRQPPWTYRSHGRVFVQPLYTGRNFAWPTDRGYMYVAEANSPAIRYRLETNNTIVAPAARLAPTQLIVLSTDGYAYCLHEQSGNILWRFSTGESLIHAPFVVDDAVYVLTEQTTLYRLAGANGLDQWSTSGVTSILAASSSRLYTMDRGGRMRIIDPKNGATLALVPIESLDFIFTNDQTDRIFIGTRKGLIQCLHEYANVWPVIHAGVGEAKKEEGDAKPGAKKPAAPAAPAEAPEANPFGGDSPFGGAGGGAGADPFGGGATPPAASSDPFGGPAAGADADPFGTP